MPEYDASTFVNREDTIPVFSFDAEDGLFNEDSPEEEAKDGSRLGMRSHLRKKMSSARIKASDARVGLQDKLLESLLQKVLGDDGMGQGGDGTTTPEHSFVERPNFNITTMSNNFRRFNSRIGVVFVFQARVVRLLSWNTWTHTASLLFTYSFICLDPYLLSILPFVILLLGVLIPAFMTRHPAPPTTLSNLDFDDPTGGPPTAPAATVKPVKELSKDFFRNMRDLQNSMEDFSLAHDSVLSTLTPISNFSNEPLTSTIFLIFVLASFVLYMAAHFIPWNIAFLLGGWFVICSGHPSLQRAIVKAHRTHVRPHARTIRSALDNWIAKDIILDTAPATREVEIFELQRKSNAGEWEPYLFTPSVYSPLSIQRLSNATVKGTRFFEDAVPPFGWEWEGKKWELDLWPKEWVEERCISCVEVETEGERWVWDLVYERDGREELERLIGSGNRPGTSGGWSTSTAGSSPKKGKDKWTPSWEDDGGSIGRRGEWRRRRWVRLVRRRNMGE